MSEIQSNHNKADAVGVAVSHNAEGASFTSTAINVINTIIGAGILSIPSTIHNTGIVGSFLLLITSLILSLFGAYYLIVASHYTKKDSFGEIADLLYGKTVKALSNFTIIIYQLGVSTAYFVILFEQVLDLLHSWGKVEIAFLSSNKYWITYLVTLFLSVPLLSINKLDNLKYTSFGAVVCIVLFVCISIYLGIVQLVDEPLEYAYLPAHPSKVAASIAVFSSALCFHANIPKMVNELKFPKTSKFKSKVKKMVRIGMIAAIASCSLYYFVGLFAYFAFGDSIEGNLLTNFQQKGYWYLGIVKFAYALVVLFSNPVVVFPALATIDELIFKGERVFWRRLLESFIWCTIVWLIAILIPQLDVVFGLTGATGGILLVYVLPAYYYIAVVKRTRKRTSNSAYSITGPDWMYRFAYILIVFTLLLGIISTITQIIDINSSS